MNELNLVEVGNSLKISREEKGWSQKEVAEKLGISRSFLSKIESGVRKISEDKLSDLLDLLQTSTEKENYNVIIDYITIFFPSNSYEKLIKNTLGMSLERFETIESAPLGYSKRLTWLNVINVLISGDDPKKGTIIELSGQGCRHLEMILNSRKINWKVFIQTVFESHGHFTRLDLSLDHYKGVLDLPELAKKIKSGYFTTSFRNCDVIQSQNLSSNDPNGLTLYLGSRKSLTHFCWYQKDNEQRRKRGISLEDAEVINRYELRYKKERAQKLAETILYYPDFSMLFFDLVNGAICFYDRNPDDPNARVDRKWLSFIENCNELKLSLESPPQSFAKSINWLSTGVSPTLAFIHEIDNFFSSSLLSLIIQSGKMNPHQQKIIEEMKYDPDYYYQEVKVYQERLQQLIRDQQKKQSTANK